MPTSLPEKNNEDRYFGKQYQRRQQEPVLIEQQLQLSKPKVRTHTYETFEDTLNENNLDDLPIALRKEKRSCVKYPISQFVSTEKLSMQHQSFLSAIDSIKIPSRLQLADMFTKGLSTKQFEDLTCKLGMIDIHSPT